MLVVSSKINSQLVKLSVYEIEKKYRDQEHPRNLSLVNAEIASVINHTGILYKPLFLTTKAYIIDNQSIYF